MGEARNYEKYVNNYQKFFNYFSKNIIYYINKTTILIRPCLCTWISLRVIQGEDSKCTEEKLQVPYAKPLEFEI
jgi:hypothetical protein